MNISFEKILILLIIAAIILGPKNLPYYAKQLGEFIRKAKRFILDENEKIKHEFGDELDLSKLNISQYNPKRIIKDALSQDASSTEEAQNKKMRYILDSQSQNSYIRKNRVENMRYAPYDTEAT